jgi:hypothetical protein
VHLEKLWKQSKLPETYNEDRVKKLLLECLEHYYGSVPVPAVIAY